VKQLFRVGVHSSQDYVSIMKSADYQSCSMGIKAVGHVQLVNPIRLILALSLLTNPSWAINDANPYTAIVGRNAFALKPPTPQTTTTPPPVVQPPSIELQGLTMILGRPQVMLKIKIPPRPPEAAKDQSVVLEVGQREGEVEVVAIDMAAGAVQLKNQGSPLSLNMQDNAATPQVAPVSMVPGTLPGLPAPRGNLPVPTLPARAVPAPGGTSGVSPFGGSTSVPQAAAPGLPMRNLRSPSGYSAPQNTGGNDARALPFEAQMALIEVERERTRPQVEAGTLPPLPPMLPPQ